jgi:hypothetical protein
LTEEEIGPIDGTLDFIDYLISARKLRVSAMNKRAMALRRIAARRTAFILLIATVLAVESLSLIQMDRTISRMPAQRQLTIDPGVVFQGW